MKFSIKIKTLRAALQFAASIVGKMPTIPILSFILIEATADGRIVVTGTDLDTTCQASTTGDVATPGTVCVTARKFVDIVRLLPDSGELVLDAGNNAWAHLTCGNVKYKIAALPREQFPEIKTSPGEAAAIALPVEVLNMAILQTSYAITNEQSRFTLSGAKMEIDGAVFRMVTTDGHRLAFVEKHFKTAVSDRAISVLIPKSALLEVTKLVKESGGDSLVSFAEDDNHVYFENNNFRIVSRKLTGTFPNYEMVLPKDNDKTVSFDAVEFLSAVARVSQMADTRDNRA